MGSQPSQIQALIQAFLQAKRLDRGAASKTLEAYGRDLAAWSRSVGVRSPEAITAMDLEKFLQGLSKSGLKAASLARKTSALRQFFKFLCAEHGLEQNPAELLESPKQDKRLPKDLRLNQVEALLKAVETGMPYAEKSDAERERLRARDRAMLYTLYATGLRVSELLNLKPGDIDIAGEFLRVRRGKGGKDRVVPFARAAGEKLHAVVASGVDPDRPLFEMTRQGFWKWLKKVAVHAGVSAEVSPHMIRHSFASHLLQGGMNLRSLQMLLGHADLSTTQMYTHLRAEHLREAHDRFHPRGGGRGHSASQSIRKPLAKRKT